MGEQVAIHGVAALSPAHRCRKGTWAPVARAASGQAKHLDSYMKNTNLQRVTLLQNTRKSLP